MKVILVILCDFCAGVDRTVLMVEKECVLIKCDYHPKAKRTLEKFDESKGSKIYLVENIQQTHHIKVYQLDYLAYVTQTTLPVNNTYQIVAVLKKCFPVRKAEQIEYA